ncbi:lantibiotic dehydratase [Streptantibioticus parmotrematis]|uniref:lantibiotic dehydratase n=1 Tax=Streptantibioticus parmotrematis TaxID=2873249 RepID=UPI0033CC6C04
MTTSLSPLAPADAPEGAVRGANRAPDGLADTAMLRINPLPGRRLGTAELATAVRTLVETEQLCTALADAACAELFDLAATATGRDRHRILDLKRAVFNHRSPGPASDGGDWPAATAAWLAARRRRDLASSVLTTGYDTCLTQERAHLAETIAAEPFQLSLALTSPQVLDAVRRYARSGGSPSKQNRKSERGILQLLARAMVRTSPLTRFTAVGFGSWSEQGSPLDRAVFQRRRAHAVVSVDRTLVSALVTGLVPAADTVTRSRSLRVAQASVRFHHVDGSQVRVLSAPLTSQLRTLLNLTALGPVTVADLSNALADRLGISVPQAERLVQGARDAQILVSGPVVDEQAADPLPQARELLRGHAPDAADRIAELSGDLARLVTAGVPERVALLRRLETTQRSLNALSSQPAQLQVNEDYLLDPFEITRTGYEQALADAAEVAEFSHLFDRHHELRALLCTLFVDRFGHGASVPLVDHAADLVNAVDSREGEIGHGGADDFGPPDGSLARLVELRQTAVRTIADRIARHTAEQPDAEELVLDTGLLAGLAAGLPERFRRTAASYGLLVQPDGGRLVLNGCYAGHGLLTTRFLGADRDLGGRTAEAVARRATALFSADGVEPLEDRGLHGVNVNHRIPLLERTITPAQWNTLRLTHDPERDDLVLRDADGAPVRPVTLGMRWLELLPAPLRLAMWLAENSRVMVESFGWEQVPPVDGPQPRHTVTAPRLVAGQVVLQRRRWYPGSDFPAAPGPQGPAAHLVDVTTWRAAHGVPEEIVIKSDLDYGSFTRQAANRNYLMNRRREKPQYVDLASALAVRVLPRLLERRPSGGYLEEALPGVRQGRHATEWLIEYDRPAGARFQLRTP